MATPTLVTITGQLRELPETPDSTATVTFRCPQTLRHLDGTVIEPFKIVGVADANGQISVSVPAVDDPAWSPQGWTYRVSIDPANGTPVVPFNASVPVAASGSGLTLGALIPVGSPSDGALYAPINHTHAEGGGGITASSTVTDGTGYGLDPAVGVSASYSRGDHSHGTLDLPSLAAIGAAAANHTHLAAGVTDLTEAVQDIVGAFVVAGTNVTKVYDDAANTLTLSAAGGGGGGVVPAFTRARITSGHFVNAVDDAFAVIPGLSISAAAVAGDNVEVVVNFMMDHGPSTNNFYDLCVLDAAGTAAVRYSSTGTATPAIEGDPSIYPRQGIQLNGIVAVYNLTLAAGDINSGSVKFGIAHKGPSGGKIFADTNYPLRWHVANYKQ